jgi:hypothetical protein
MKRSDFPPNDDDCLLENDEARRLGNFLRKYAPPAPERDCSGFNAAVLQRIAAETPAPVFLPLRRLLWGGLGGLAAAAALFVAWVQPALQQPGPPPEYYARILKATTSDPAISAVAVHSQQDDVTVLWIDGLDYIPSAKAN